MRYVKGKELKPGLTITDGWRTWVITNQHVLHCVSSGNHAEVHMSGLEFEVFWIMLGFTNFVDTISKAMNRGKKQKP